MLFSTIYNAVSVAQINFTGIKFIYLDSKFLTDSDTVTYIILKSIKQLFWWIVIQSIKLVQIRGN